MTGAPALVALCGAPAGIVKASPVFTSFDTPLISTVSTPSIT